MFPKHTLRTSVVSNCSDAKSGCCKHSTLENHIYISGVISPHLCLHVEKYKQAFSAVYSNTFGGRSITAELY